MSTLIAMGITIADQTSEQIGVEDIGVRNLYAAVLYSAIHDLVTYKNLSSHYTKETQGIAYRNAALAHNWIFNHCKKLSFPACCKALDLDEEIMIKAIEKMEILLPEDPKIIPHKVRSFSHGRYRIVERNVLART